MPHTRQCSLNRTRIYKRRYDYERRWPDYCRECGGRGVWSVAELIPSPTIRTGLAFQSRVVVCPGCIWAKDCPRCGKPLIIDQVGGKIVCESCSWTPSAPALPELPECICGAATLAAPSVP